MELAISVTVLLFLLAGAIDFGMALFSYVSLRDAAQEGALYGSIKPDDVAGIEARVRAGAPKDPDVLSFYPVDLSDTSLVNVDISFPPGNQQCEGFTGGVANGVQVTVSFDFPISMPLTGKIIGSNTIPLHAVVTDTILSPPCP